MDVSEIIAEEREQDLECCSTWSVFLLFFPLSAPIFLIYRSLKKRMKKNRTHH
jgi:hypothetical protein